MSHANISVFVPHNGCPHQCSFCNQRGITGVNRQPDVEDVVKAIETSLTSPSCDKIKERELAFFGGSFTAIDRNYMVKLLEATVPYIRSGKIQGIRISTRPDAIDCDILSVLKSYGVTAIELGAQSMDNYVLKLNDRGHNCEDVEKACKLIRNAGFQLGLQMMVGLYGSDVEKDLYTCEKFIELRPDTVRVYPTVIMRGTKLADLYDSGQYKPMDFDDMVDLCAQILDKFEYNNINVIRLGLHSSESLKSDIVAGTWHPAFREICESRRFFNMFVEKIKLLNCTSKRFNVRINSRDTSKFIGQKRSNMAKILDMGYEIELLTDDEIKKGCIEIEELF